MQKSSAMTALSPNSWDRIGEAFADQFEQDGASFVYRRSQRGEAIRVSAEEHIRFVEEFERNVRRAKWIIYLGLTVVLGGLLILSLIRGSDLSQLAIFIGIGLVMIPYVAYYRWAWAAPARELATRTPIAGERSPDEIRRLTLQRLTYRQLAATALGGLIIPFIGSSRQDLFSGWNRLWLVFGGAIICLAAVQAFRKWRWEQEDSYSNAIPRARSSNIAESNEDSKPPVKDQLWRYLPLAVILLGIAFVALTPAGKRLGMQPSFWPILLIGCGGWSLFTVARGFSKGEIEPFARGFYKTYERDTQPKRFWASMAWNGIFGCLCLWLALMTNGQASAEAAERQCYDQRNAFSARQELAACNKLISKSDKGDLPYLLGARAAAYQRLNARELALADYSRAIRLNPREPFNHFNRGLVYQQHGDTRPAIADFTAVISLQPNSAEAYLQRGSAYEHIGLLDQAISDFDEVVRLKPDHFEGYYYRGEAYANRGDDERAKADFATAVRLNPNIRSPYS